MTTWADQLYQFYTSLQPPGKLPNGVEWLYPQADGKVLSIVKQFLDAFYADTKKRTILLGINPGRFGAGVTGVNFTAQKQLKEDCGIQTDLKPQSELSAQFIYKMIHQYGGPTLFYSHYFIGSVCPLGFVKEGKNINYYDDKDLLHVVEPFILKNLEALFSFPVHRDRCIAIGGEKNYKYLLSLNKKHKWVNEIIPLPHPRFIMQYRLRQQPLYIDQYLEVLKKS